MHNNTKIESISIPLTTTITAKKVMLVMEVTVMINMVTKIRMTITIEKTKAIIKMTTQPLK